MRRLFAPRRRVLAVGALAAVAVVVATGFGYAAVAADNQSYTGCLDPGGAISSVKIGATPLKPCPKSSQQISWSQTGPPGTNGIDGADGTNGTNGTNGSNGTDGTNGTDGVSVTSEPEAAGANCANGGSKFTAADDNVTYACNGQDGEDGTGASLVGSPCSLPDETAGTVQMSVAANGAISLVCQTAGGGTDLCDEVPTYPNATTHCDPETGTLSITCSTGFANGDNAITNGCEINLLTDPANCGFVGHVVSLPNAIAGCSNGLPVILGCNANFANVDQAAANGCEVNLLTDVNNCGAVGNRGATNVFVATWSCVAGTLEIVACQGEHYDVNNAAFDGCERLQPRQGITIQGTAFNLGSTSCDDGASASSISGTLYSDSQQHANPSIPAFNSVTGSAPAWYRVHAEGGLFCLNDYEVTFTTGGGLSTPSCYRLTILTNQGTNAADVSGQGSATRSGAYSDDTDIFFRVEKTCTLPGQQIQYTIQFHL